MSVRRLETRTLLLLALGALLLAGGLYVVGLLQGRGLLAGEVSGLEARVEALDAELQGERAALAAARDRARLLEARSLLFETAIDLDRRNFGTANQHLDAAGRALAEVGAGAAGDDPDAIRALARQVAATDLNVATNLETQRTRVLGFATRLRELAPALPAPAAPAARDST